MDDEQALLASLRDDPNNDTLRLAFADWLMEHDQPERAAWIREREIFWWMGPDYVSPLPAILEQLRNEDPNERDKAGPVVGLLRGAVVPLLREAFATGDTTLRCGIAEIFSWIRDGTPRPVPELMPDVRSDEPNAVRIAVIELQWHGAAAVPAIPALIEAWERWGLYDHSEGLAHGLRRSIVLVLEQIGPPALDALPFLILGLGRNYHLAEPVSRAVMAMGLLSAMPGLEDFLRHSNDWLRLNAAAVLFHAPPTSSKAASFLRGFLAHTDRALANAARDVLHS